MISLLNFLSFHCDQSFPERWLPLCDNNSIVLFAVKLAFAREHCSKDCWNSINWSIECKAPYAVTIFCFRLLPTLIQLIIASLNSRYGKTNSFVLCQYKAKFCVAVRVSQLYSPLLKTVQRLEEVMRKWFLALAVFSLCGWGSKNFIFTLSVSSGFERLNLNFDTKGTLCLSLTIAQSIPVILSSVFNHVF